MRNQYDILCDIQKAGYNVVTCGECGDVFLHDSDQEELVCPYCEFTGDVCDFPDLFYEGWKMQKPKPKPKKHIGFQIESADGLHDIPSGYSSFQILSMATVNDFFENSDYKYTHQWKIVPVYEGEIENPSFI